MKAQDELRHHADLLNAAAVPRLLRRGRLWRGAGHVDRLAHHPVHPGMVLGDLDEDIRRVFAGGNAIILPFLGFEFGSTVNLIEAFKMIPQGLLPQHYT